MGISEREYRAMLAGNDQLRVKDDGAPRNERTGKAKTPLVACSHFSAPAPVPTEHEEQVALFQWAEANEGAMPELALLFAVPNGGYRPMATAAMLREEGVKAGVPDVVLPVARGRFHSLWLELKRSNRSNHATPAQQEWIERLRSYGHMVVVAYGAQEAIDAITTYLNTKGHH